MIFSLLSTRSSLTLDDKTYEHEDILVLFGMSEALFTAGSHIPFHTVNCKVFFARYPMLLSRRSENL